MITVKPTGRVLGASSLWRCVLLFLFIMSNARSAAAQSWEKLPSMPVPSGGFIAGEHEGKIIVLGGTNWEGGQKAWLSSVFQFDPAAKTWVQLASLSTPIAYGAGVTIGNTFVVLGGSTGQAPSRALIRVVGGKVETVPTGGLTQPAVLSASGAIDGQIIVVGGTDDAANVKGLGRATIAFDPKTGTTRELSEFPGAGFGVAGNAVVNGELFVFAGVTWNAGHNAIANTMDAHAFSLARNQWRSLAAYPIPVRGLTAVALDADHIYLAGGYGAEDFTDRAFVYDVTSDRYEAAVALPYRGQVGLVKCGDYVYCIGGEDRMKHRTDAVFRIFVSTLLKAKS